MVKNTLTYAGDIRATGSIPVSERSPGDGNGNPSSIPAWRIPWTGSLEDYSPGGHKEADTTEVTLAHKMIIMLSLVICHYTKMFHNY